MRSLALASSTTRSSPSDMRQSSKSPRRSTPRQRVLQRYPRATVYVTGYHPDQKFTIFGSDGRSRPGSHWLSNKQLCEWAPSKKEAWAAAERNINA